MDTPVFDWVRDRCPSKAVAWDLGNRPDARGACDAGVLDPDTVIVADCEPKDFRVLVREWGDPRAAEEIAEEMYQRDLERAAQPPVIEVTVTTPPDGIPRLELTRLVAEKVAEITGPLPVLPPRPGQVSAVEGRQSRRRKVLTAIRRRRVPDVPLPSPAPEPAPAGTGWVLAASEDDTPTAVLPPYPGDGFELVEVHVP